MTLKQRASNRNVSLYGRHRYIIDWVAKDTGIHLQAQPFSQALQRALDDYAKLKKIPMEKFYLSQIKQAGHHQLTAK